MLNNMENGQKNKQGNYRFTDDYLPLLVFLLCLAVGLGYLYRSWSANRQVAGDATAVFSMLLVLMVMFWRVRKNAQMRKLSEDLAASTDLFQKVFAFAPLGIALLDAEDNNFMVNPMLEQILGRTRQELLQTHWTSITHPDDLAEDQELYRRWQAGTIEHFYREKRFLRPDGSAVWCAVQVTPLRLRAGQVAQNMAIVEDIHEKRLALEALRESERSKSVILINLPGMAYRCRYDRDWTMLFVSEGCLELTGYPPASFINNQVLSFNQVIAPEYRDQLWQEWEKAVPEGVPFRSEYEIVTAQGVRKWVLEIGRAIYNVQGVPEALEGIIIDINAEKEKEAMLRYISEHDFMTGVHNRTCFEEMLGQLEGKAHLPLSVMAMDINGVRLINNAFGYDAGDRLIAATAKILQDCCRAQDVLARIGGDEFGLLMPNTDAATASIMVSTIKEAVAAYNRNRPGQPYEMSLSIGFATKETTDERNFDTLKQADDSLRNRMLLNQHSSHNAIVASIMATVYEKSQETEEHAKRLAALSSAIGRKLNLSHKNLDELELFAMLHDIGKAVIDDRILNKPGRLDEAEWEIMRKHPEIGHRIAKSADELEPIAGYILTHHEHWDGSGYPRGLKGAEIPLLSRILAVADAFDAMTEDRVYRKALSAETALAEIEKCAGTQFDPEIVRIFLAIMRGRG